MEACIDLGSRNCFSFAAMEEENINATLFFYRSRLLTLRIFFTENRRCVVHFLPLPPVWITITAQTHSLQPSGDEPEIVFLHIANHNLNLIYILRMSFFFTTLVATDNESTWLQGCPIRFGLYNIGEASLVKTYIF